MINALAKAAPMPNPPLKSMANAKDIAAHALNRSLNSISLVDT